MAEEKINVEKFGLYGIKKDWGFGVSAAKNAEEKRVLIKMKRDLLGITKIICDDMNLKSDQNYQEIKKQVKSLAKYMFSQLTYLERIFEYGLLPQSVELKEALLKSEYAKTVYDMESDYPYWSEYDVFEEKGPQDQLDVLNKIHNSSLSKAIAQYHVDILTYKTIRKNNWGRNKQAMYNHTLPVSLKRKSDLGRARETARKQRNVCLKELYTLFAFINGLTNKMLLTKVSPETESMRPLESYNVLRKMQKEINEESNAFQKQLRYSTNASCWLDNGIKHTN